MDTKTNNIIKDNAKSTIEIFADDKIKENLLYQTSYYSFICNFLFYFVIGNIFNCALRVILNNIIGFCIHDSNCW